MQDLRRMSRCSRKPTSGGRLRDHSVSIPRRPDNPGPSTRQHEPFQDARQFAEIRLRLDMEDEVEEGLINTVVQDAGDDAAVLCDHLVETQRIPRIALGALDGGFKGSAIGERDRAPAMLPDIARPVWDQRGR